MRGAVLAFVACAAATTLADDDLLRQLPEGVSVLGWERITGEVTTPRIHAVYHFYVNPERPALYQVMHYRLTFPHPAARQEQRYPSTEKLVWNARPGQRALPLRCFELLAGTASAPAHWREMTHGTYEYRMEMAVVMQLLMLHRSARLNDDPTDQEPERGKP